MRGNALPTFVLPEFLDTRSGELLARHLSRSKEWFPHELVPWSQGRDFLPGQTDGYPTASPLELGVRSALFVNLLTEDTLPHYFHAIIQAFGADSAMGDWSRRWAAEEQRHAMVIRDWLCVTRGIDLVALERARMHQVTTGFSTRGRDDTLSDGLVYLALQNAVPQWTRTRNWTTALLAFKIHFGDRVPDGEN